jgi:hypothetical protein
MLLIPTYMAQKYNFNINDNFFSLDYSKKTDIAPILDWNAFAIINMLKDVENLNKYKLIDQYVLNNVFYMAAERDVFFANFCAAQKHLACLTRFVNRVKWHALDTYSVDMDLNLNLLSDLDSKLKITLVENNLKYVFRLSDLINISNSSLGYSPNFFAKPLDIKNPYTNLAFSKANLYNIYFALRHSNYIMPIMFHQYFMTNFELDLFFYNNESYIREYTIKNYVYTTDVPTLYSEVLYMINKNNYIFKNIKIHTTFPKKILVDTFRNMLYDYYDSVYSYSDSKRIYKKRILKQNGKQFVKKYPKFGRKIYCLQSDPKDAINITIEFVTTDNYDKFNNYDTANIIENTISSTIILNETDETIFDASSNRVRTIEQISSNSIDYYTMLDEINITRDRHTPIGNVGELIGTAEVGIPIVLDNRFIDEVMLSVEHAINGVLNINGDIVPASVTTAPASVTTAPASVTTAPASVTTAPASVTGVRNNVNLLSHVNNNVSWFNYNLLINSDVIDNYTYDNIDNIDNIANDVTNINNDVYNDAYNDAYSDAYNDAYNDVYNIDSDSDSEGGDSEGGDSEGGDS